MALLVKLSQKIFPLRPVFQFKHLRFQRLSHPGCGYAQKLLISIPFNEMGMVTGLWKKRPDKSCRIFLIEPYGLFDKSAFHSLPFQSLIFVPSSFLYNGTVWESSNSPQAEADNVFMHVTGCYEWDSCADEGPSDLSEWLPIII